eukprot:14058635-Alexandrium_andersonii.AAC.1
MPKFIAPAWMPSAPASRGTFMRTQARLHQGDAVAGGLPVQLGELLAPGPDAMGAGAMWQLLHMQA